MTPMIIEYIIIEHTKDSLVGSNGRCISEDNPPAYLAGSIDEIKRVGTWFCCAEMSHHFKAGHIGFGGRPENTYHNTSSEVYIRVAAGPEQDIPLPYCPWCTQPVITREVGKI